MRLTQAEKYVMRDFASDCKTPGTEVSINKLPGNSKPVEVYARSIINFKSSRLMFPCFYSAKRFLRRNKIEYKISTWGSL